MPARPPTAAPEPLASPAAGMTRREFFADVVDTLRPMLPPDLRDFRHRATSTILKLWYDNERVHYEVWCNGQLGTIEIGLHFEDGPVSTAAYLHWFDRQIVELKHDLGPTLELERWTASWGHLFETRPLGRLDLRTVDLVCGRLAIMVPSLQPLVVAASVPPEYLPGERPAPRARWHRAARA